MTIGIECKCWLVWNVIINIYIHKVNYIQKLDATMASILCLHLSDLQVLSG